MITRKEDGTYTVQVSRGKRRLEYGFAVVRGGKIFTVRKSDGGDDRDERGAKEALRKYLRKAEEDQRV